jgi:hypothetical protein
MGAYIRAYRAGQKITLKLLHFRVKQAKNWWRWRESNPHIKHEIQTRAYKRGEFHSFSGGRLRICFAVSLSCE